MTKQYGLTNLISQSTAEGAADLALIEIDKVQLVGRGAATSIFTVLGDSSYAGEEEFLELKRVHDQFLQRYRNFELDKAAESLGVLESICPPVLKKTYSLFRDRLEKLAMSPRPQDWTGVYVAEKK